MLNKQVFAPAGKEKSSGGSPSPDLEPGEIRFIDQTPAVPEAPKAEIVPEPVESEAKEERIAQVEAAPKVLGDEAIQPIKREERKEELPQKGVVFENSKGERKVVERVERDKTVVYREERAKDIRKKRGVYLSRKPVENFRVLVGVEGMKEVDPIRESRPEFYAEYEREMVKVENAFSCEFETALAKMDKWYEMLEDSTKRVAKRKVGLIQIHQLRIEIEKIAAAFDKINGQLVKDCRQKIELLSKMRELGKNIPEAIQLDEAEQEVVEKEYGSEEPNIDIESVEREYQKFSFEKTVKQLNEVAKRLEERYEKARIGRLDLAPNALSGKEFEKKVNSLLLSVTEQSSPEEVKRVFDDLDKLDEQTFVEKSQYGNGRGRGKKRNGEEVGGRVKTVDTKLRSEQESDKSGSKNKRSGEEVVSERVTARQMSGTGASSVLSNGESGGKPRSERRNGAKSVAATTEGKTPPTGELHAEQNGTLSEEEIKEAVEGFGYLLMDKARSVHTRINELSLSTISDSTRLYNKKGRRKIFLPKDDANGLLVAYQELPSEAKAAADKKWQETNYDLESEFLGKRFLIALEEVKQKWEDKIRNARTFRELKDIGNEQEVRDGRQKKAMRVFIPTDPRDRSKEFLPVLEVLDEMIEHRRTPEGSDLRGFSKLFSEQLRPIIEKANRDIFSLWDKRRRELSEGNGGRAKSGKPRRGRTIEGEKVSFESAVPEEQQEKITTEMRGFVAKGLALIDAGLKKAEGRGLDDFLRSTDPKDRNRVSLLLQKGIGANVVKIGQAYGIQTEAGDAERVAAAIEEKGKALLLEAMKQRLLPDKTKVE